MTRQTLEKRQVFIYLAAILAGLAVGGASPNAAGTFDPLLWPALGTLLYTTFAQVPLSRLRGAFADIRFLTAAVIGNFFIVPALVWGLAAFLPDDPAIRLGVVLVLLVPCTDWFITFTQLGQGDARRAIALTPINLLLQIALLPVYVWVFMGGAIVAALATDDLAAAFVGLILIPLFLAFLTQKWTEAGSSRKSWLERLAWFPVPLLAVVVFLVAASQVGTVMGSVPVLARLLPIFVAFLGAAAVIAWILARLFALDTARGRTLAFSLGTRNSFVVLPLAIALPPSWEAAVVVIVLQALVELFGMAAYLWWVPKKLSASMTDAPLDRV